MPKIFSKFRRDKADAPVRRRRLSDHDEATRTTPAAAELPPLGSYSYRRNQTLTGSRSSVVASAGVPAVQRQSPRQVAHGLRRTRRKLGMVLASVLVAALGVASLLYQYIDTVDVAIYGQVQTAARSGDYERYEQAVDQYLREHPLQRFRASLDTVRLQQYLVQTLDMAEVQRIEQPEFRAVGQTAMSIKMREPLASWSLGGERQYVDRSGAIFKKNYYPEPSVTIVDKSNIRVDSLQAVMSGRFLSFIGQTVGAFRELDRAVSEVIIPPDTTHQIIAVLGGYQVKLVIDRPVGEQAEDAVRAVTYLQGRGWAAEYVDVRVSGRAYYRDPPAGRSE